MTPIRALFFLAAITAACAGRIPVQVETTHSLSTQIALLSHGNLGSNPIENAIEKLMELVRMLKEKVHQLENVLLDALQASSVAVAKKINDLIYEKTGIDLNLEKKLEAFEKKAETCNAAFKTDLKQVIGEIKTKAQTCAATEIAAVMDIRTRVVTLIELLEVVPAQTIEKIKACVAPTTMAPPTEAPTTMAPPTEAPTTMAPPTEAPTTMEPPTEAPANLGSWSDIWKEAKCVTQELAAAAEQLADVPAQVAKVVSDAAELHTKETIDKLEKCAVQSLAGMEDRVQLAAAQLAYCVIAPSKQQ